MLLNSRVADRRSLPDINNGILIIPLNLALARAYPYSLRFNTAVGFQFDLFAYSLLDLSDPFFPDLLALPAA